MDISRSSTTGLGFTRGCTNHRWEPMGAAGGGAGFGMGRWELLGRHRVGSGSPRALRTDVALGPALPSCGANSKLWGAGHQRQDGATLVCVCRALFKEEFLQSVVTSFFLPFFKIFS